MVFDSIQWICITDIDSWKPGFKLQTNQLNLFVFQSGWTPIETDFLTEMGKPVNEMLR